MTITYLSGGKIGDFIQQLSIVYERHIRTKEKATIYISDAGDTFRHGVAKAFEDLQPVLSKQDYIGSFEIYSGEKKFDVDLTSWREYNRDSSYVDRIFDLYGIKWGQLKWIHNIPTEIKWGHLVIINTTSYRFPDNIDWDSLIMKYGKENMLFVSFEKEEHTYFENRCFPVEYYKPSSLYNLFVIIQSCKMFIGSLSAPLSIALSMHTPSIIGYVGSKLNYMDYIIFKDIKKNMRRSYLLTTDLRGERALFCHKLLTGMGFENIIVSAVPHEDPVVSNKTTMRNIYKTIVADTTTTEWSYVFEDDINILEPIDISEIIEYENISHTFFYLGCCGPKYPILTENRIRGKPVWRIEKGNVRGLHAIGITKQGASELLFLLDKEENQDINYVDVVLEKLAQVVQPNIIRFDLESYIQGHKGIFFQDRNAFPSSIDPL